MSDEKNIPDDVKKLLEKHEKDCEKRHEEVRDGFKEVRREFREVGRKFEEVGRKFDEVGRKFEEVGKEFKEVRQEFNGAIKEVRDTMRSNITWTLIAIGLGVSVIGYLQYNSPATVLHIPALPAPAVQTAPPKTTSEDTPSILEQRNAETAK